MAGYVDREIEPAQVSAISQHLQDCPGCAEEAQAQQKMKDLVRERALRVRAPAHVRAEIRRRLDRDSSGFDFFTLMQNLFPQRPISAIAVIVVLMFLSGLATYMVFQNQSTRNASNTHFVAGSIEGVIICVDCGLLDLLKTPFVHDATHRLGVRCHDGHIWSILRSEKSKDLSDKMDRHVRIVGNLFEGMQYVEVKEFSLI